MKSELNERGGLPVNNKPCVCVCVCVCVCTYVQGGVEFLIIGASHAGLGVQVLEKPSIRQQMRDMWHQTYRENVNCY